MIRWFLATGAVIVLATAGVAYVGKQHEITFAHLRDAKDHLLSAGFRCISDRADGATSTGFLISEQAMTWSEAGALRKVGPMGPEWKGKVWVTLTRDDWRLAAIPDEAGLRVWGSVIAFGDEDLLQELDKTLAPAAFTFQ